MNSASAAGGAGVTLLLAHFASICWSMRSASSLGLSALTCLAGLSPTAFSCAAVRDEPSSKPSTPSGMNHTRRPFMVRSLVQSYLRMTVYACLVWAANHVHCTARRGRVFQIKLIGREILTGL